MSLLEVSHLEMRFGGLCAVQDVSLKVEAGEIVGLIGPNGAGKTTCFNVLTGVYVPTAGSVKFEGQEISGLAPHKVCRTGLSRTFQNIRLFKELTVLENVLVSLHRQRPYNAFEAVLRTPRYRQGEKALREEAMDCLEGLGLGNKAWHLAKNLPYGEQRKVEIARALAARPKLLLLDEPAAGMNPSETAELSELILQIRERFKNTVLLIEHDMSLVMKICERLYVLDYGKLIAQGRPKEIQNDARVIEAYLGGSLGEATV